MVETTKDKEITNLKDAVAEPPTNVKVEPEDVKKLQNIIATNKIKPFRNVSSRRGGYISVVRSDTGTRLVISKYANEQLGYPKELFIGFEEDCLLIFNAEGLDSSNITVGKNDQQRLSIYNTALVDLIIQEFNLDYSDKTSQSFVEGHFKNQGRPVLYVKMV